MIYVYILLLVIHILLCVLTFLGIHLRFLKVHKYMFFVVLCLPFWGFLLVILLHSERFLKQDASLDVGVEKMKLDSVLYQSVEIDKDDDEEIVPIEEALIVNSYKERREIIMDVLNDNPKEYIEFLKKAGNNDDTEVVHYAVTAMVEISKENDYMLQKLERKHSKNPDDYDVLKEYIDFVWHCLTQGLMQGQVEVLNRNLFSDLIRKKIGIKEEKEDYIRLFENAFSLKNYTEAGDVLNKLEEKYGFFEELFLLKIKYFATLGKGDKIHKLIDETENMDIYLPYKVKEEIAFWKN